MTNILKQDDWDEPEEFDTAFFKGYREVNHALAYRDLALFDWLVNEIHMSSCHDESGTYIFRTRQQIREEFRDLSQRQLNYILESLQQADLITIQQKHRGLNLYLNPRWKCIIHQERKQYEEEHPTGSAPASSAERTSDPQARSSRNSRSEPRQSETELPAHSGNAGKKLPLYREKVTLSAHQKRTSLPAHSEYGNKDFPAHSEKAGFPTRSEEASLPAHCGDQKASLPAHSEYGNENLPTHSEQAIPIKETNVEEQTDVEEEAKKQTKGRLDLDQTYLGHSYSDNLEPKNSELYVLTESLAEPEQRQPAEKAPSSWKPETFCGEGPEADGEPICSRRMTEPPEDSPKEDNWAVEPEEPFPEDESWKFRDPWETGTGGEDDPPAPEPRDADESDPAPEIRPEPKPAGFQPQDPVPDRNPEPHPPRVSPSPSSFLQSRHRSPAKPVYNFAELLQGDHAPSRAKIEALDRKIEDERRRKEEQTAGTAGSDSEPETIPAEPDVSGDPAGEAPPEADQPEKKPQFDFWSLLDDEHRKAAQRDKLAPDVRERLEWQDEAREAQKAEDEEYWTYVEHGGGEDDSPPGPERQSREIRHTREGKTETEDSYAKTV